MNQKKGLDYLFDVGKNVLGERYKEVERKAVEMAGVMACMGAMYAADRNIASETVNIDFGRLEVKFLDKDLNPISILKLEMEDIQDPSQWIVKTIKGKS